MCRGMACGMQARAVWARATCEKGECDKQGEMESKGVMSCFVERFGYVTESVWVRMCRSSFHRVALNSVCEGPGEGVQAFPTVPTPCCHFMTFWLVDGELWRCWIKEGVSVCVCVCTRAWLQGSMEAFDSLSWVWWDLIDDLKKKKSRGFLLLVLNCVVTGLCHTTVCVLSWRLWNILCSKVNITSFCFLFAFFLSHVDRSDEAKQHHNSTPSILHVYPSHLLDVLRV